MMCDDICIEYMHTKYVYQIYMHDVIQHKKGGGARDADPS